MKLITHATKAINAIAPTKPRKILLYVIFCIIVFTLGYMLGVAVAEAVHG